MADLYDDEPETDEALTADDVHSTNDLMLAVAQAMETLDFDLLRQLRQRCDGWLQMRDERDAQFALIDAAELLMERAR